MRRLVILGVILVSISLFFIKVLYLMIQPPFASYNAQEKFINSKKLSSYSSYLIWVDVTEQMTYVFKGYTNHWRLYKSMYSATGIKGYETPDGIYTVQSRGTWFYSTKYGEGAEYWTQFYGNYLFHSFPMDKNHKILDTVLGRPDSHGCVHLTVDNAKWIYDYMPKGTKVDITGVFS